MQDNQPLMQSLASLVSIANPDFIIFIGEALTGNDGVDQLVKFNNAIKLSELGREIDGIILSKFDTVDNKVGAAISLVYATGKPIVFLGTGQKYHNLQKVNPAQLVSQLLA